MSKDPTRGTKTKSTYREIETASFHRLEAIIGWARDAIARGREVLDAWLASHQQPSPNILDVHGETYIGLAVLRRALSNADSHILAEAEIRDLETCLSRTPQSIDDVERMSELLTKKTHFNTAQLVNSDGQRLNDQRGRQLRQIDALLIAFRDADGQKAGELSLEKTLI